jgi:hypothetical protein
VTLKKLTVGDRSFSFLIDNNYLYADKTKYIFDLINSGEKDFFLSRPRRFGKTLLLRTLIELFSGNRERFNNLWIGQSDYTFPRHPVIYLSLSSFTAPSPAVLQTRLLGKLNRIAALNHLNIRGDSPEVFFGELIESLCQRYDSPVAVLIDEYDAPVTRNMANLDVAKANAEILHDFFATMKDVPVSDCIHFSLFTGITRYALTSMDSGPNHLTDISLDPEYAGICGFTLDEFSSLFADRMAPALARLKASGAMPPSADLTDLSSQIHQWYDGYNWCGQTKVLNPYSILKFFKTTTFDRYWILSGRPTHLTSLIKARPFEFIKNKLTSYLSVELRKADLNQLQIIPILFHSGYLTIDTVEHVEITNPQTSELITDQLLTFKLPNYEVASIYLTDCFNALFDQEPNHDFVTWRNEFQQAFLDRNSQAVTDRFTAMLSHITYNQRINDEKTFHLFVQSILSTMKFKVLSEVPGAKGRLDLAIELPGEIYVIIELKYCPNMIVLNKNDEINILSSYAMRNLPKNILHAKIANVLSERLGASEIDLICTQNGLNFNKSNKTNNFLYSIARNYLSTHEIDTLIALEAKERYSKDIINNVLREASKSKVSQEQIDAELTSAVSDALAQIEKGRYHGPFAIHAKEFIDLGMALYGDGSSIKAAFRPKNPTIPAPERPPKGARA